MRVKRYKTRHKSFLAKKLERKERKKFFLTIFLGGVFVYALFTWFLPALIGSLSFLNQYKPLPKKEAPISESIVLAPPVLNIPFEATNTASISIKGYANPSSKVDIYIDEEYKTTAETSEDGSFTSEQINLNFGTNSIYGQTKDEKGNKSLTSKPIVIVYDNEKPTLELTEPNDNEVVTGNKRVNVSGKTDSGNNWVSVNGARLIINSEGNFSHIVDLQDGENEIVVIAKDLAGNTTQITRRVIYQSAP